MRHKRRSDYDEDNPVDLVIGSFSTGLGPELDGEGHPVVLPKRPPIGFVPLGENSFVDCGKHVEGEMLE